MRIWPVNILLLLSLSCFSQIKKKKALFIGNSYTYVNNLPQLIKDIALSKSDTLLFDQSVLGGATFNTHYNNPQTYSLIKSQNWDVVVIQGQSQEPSLQPVTVMNNSYPYLRMLSDSVRKYLPCTELMYFMTWGRKNSDPDNCPTYTPSCSYAGMQARLRESYLMFADSFNAASAPVGVAWKTFRNLNPAVDLYDLDESHPSINGSYLAACVFYSSIFQKAVSGATFYATLTPSLAQSMQNIGGSTVLDSTKVWNLNSSTPLADFTYSLSGGTTYQFSNLSVNGSAYNWSFGSTSYSPAYTFTGSPPFVVTLSVSNSCTVSSVTKTIQVTGLEQRENCISEIHYTEGSYLKWNVCDSDLPSRLMVTDLMGRIIFNREVGVRKGEFDLNELSPGLYNCNLYNTEGKVLTKKIMK